MVGGVRLLPAAPVHQTLQLDQEELLGSGEVRGGGASGKGGAELQGWEVRGGAQQRTRHHRPPVLSECC